MWSVSSFCQRRRIGISPHLVKLRRMSFGRAPRPIRHHAACAAMRKQGAKIWVGCDRTRATSWQNTVAPAQRSHLKSARRAYHGSICKARTQSRAFFLNNAGSAIGCGTLCQFTLVELARAFLTNPRTRTAEQPIKSSAASSGFVLNGAAGRNCVIVEELAALLFVSAA